MRRSAACASVASSGRRAALRGGRLALSATIGETNQAPAKAAARGQAFRRPARAQTSPDRGDADHQRADHPRIEAACAQTGCEGRLGGRNPLQQMAPRQAEPDQGAQHSVTHQPRLVRQKNDGQAGLDQRQAQFLGQGPPVAGEHDTGSTALA